MWRLSRLAPPLLAALVLAACGGPDTPTFQGWVEADLVFVGPDEAGRVETLSVSEGAHVVANTELFTVDDDLQQSDVKAASASVAEAQARLARLEAAQQRREEIAVLEAQERRAESALALSTIELERQQSLAAKGIAAKAQLDIATANYRRDQAALEEVRRQIQVARLPSREEDIAAAKETLAAAKARLVAAQTRLARRRLTSPVAGTVEQIYYRPGEMVPAGRPVVALLPPANLKIRFFVPQAVLPQMAAGRTVAVSCDGCEPGLTARISFIARSAEFTPPVIYSLEERAKLVFLIEARPDHPEKLRVGQPVTVVPAERKP